MWWCSFEFWTRNIKDFNVALKENTFFIHVLSYSWKVLQKMAVLNVSRKMCRALGIISNRNGEFSLKNILNYLILSFFLLAVNIPSFIFLISNIENMTTVTHVVYCIAATGLLISHYWYFIYCRQDLSETFNNLQILVDKSEFFEFSMQSEVVIAAPFRKDFKNIRKLWTSGKWT